MKNNLINEHPIKTCDTLTFSNLLYLFYRLFCAFILVITSLFFFASPFMGFKPIFIKSYCNCEECNGQTAMQNFFTVMFFCALFFITLGVVTIFFRLKTNYIKKKNFAPSKQKIRRIFDVFSLVVRSITTIFSIGYLIYFYTL